MEQTLLSPSEGRNIDAAKEKSRETTLRNELVLYASQLKKSLDVPEERGLKEAYRFDTRRLMVQFFISLSLVCLF